MKTRKRTLTLAAVAALVALTALARSGLPSRLGGVSPGLAGTPLGGDPAPDFALTDHRGRETSLSSLRGRVVVLTFLYTSCPDTCPLITTKLGQVHDRLGEQARDVAFVAVTVDPERDDGPRLRQYLEAQRLDGRLLFLTGDRAALEAVWKAYHIGVSRAPPTPSDGSRSATSGEILHNDVLYLIDRAGRKRALLREDFAPAELVESLRVLLREPGGDGVSRQEASREP